MSPWLQAITAQMQTVTIPAMVSRRRLEPKSGVGESCMGVQAGRRAVRERVNHPAVEFPSP